MKHANDAACSCIKEIQKHCAEIEVPEEVLYDRWTMDDPEFGKIAYTISILLMFSFVIVLLMVRSIRRSHSTIEVSHESMDTLLDAMRFREELDIQERQRRRLMKAKHKVSAWLTKTHSENGTKGWQSSPSLIPTRRYTSSTVSEIPEIVVTDDGSLLAQRRPHTPCLSLIYDFGEEHRKSIDVGNGRRSSGPRTSICSEISLAGSRDSLARATASLDTDDHHPPRLQHDNHSLSLG